MAKFMCPHCHSEHIQKYSIVYQNGASQITTSNGEEVRIIGEGLTQLAQQVAPPAKKETHRKRRRKPLALAIRRRSLPFLIFICLNVIL